MPVEEPVWTLKNIQTFAQGSLKITFNQNECFLIYSNFTKTENVQKKKGKFYTNTITWKLHRKQKRVGKLLEITNIAYTAETVELI